MSRITADELVDMYKVDSNSSVDQVCNGHAVYLVKHQSYQGAHEALSSINVTYSKNISDLRVLFKTYQRLNKSRQRANGKKVLIEFLSSRYCSSSASSSSSCSSVVDSVSSRDQRREQVKISSLTKQVIDYWKLKMLNWSRIWENLKLS